MNSISTKISLKLHNELSCEYICQNIQNLVNTFTKKNIDLSNYLLVCDLVEIKETDQTLSLRIGVKQ